MNQKLSKKRNIRDLSYLVREDGRRLPEGLFFRGAAIRKMNASNKKAFRELGIKTIIDLRTAAERKRKPDLDIPGAVNLHIPIISEQTIGITHEHSAIGYSDPPDMRKLYAKMVTDEESIDALRRVFDVVLDPNREGPVYWHCTEGKDRCGIVTALLLLALGFNKETIISDYSFNHPNSEKKGRLYRFLVRYVLFKRHMSEAVYQTMLAIPDYLESAFDAMEKQCGSLRAFLIERIGLTPERMAPFKERFMLPSKK